MIELSAHPLPPRQGAFFYPPRYEGGQARRARGEYESFMRKEQCGMRRYVAQWGKRYRKTPQSEIRDFGQLPYRGAKGRMLPKIHNFLADKKQKL